ncbi:hypothetical protein OS190_05435 [Sulfitobacter sp. F26204]|nr:hypothetical protein [Sulfitobacter sp. F26204]MCX7559003.1 hypothetical protein [Sulfitobacter sp. F26204]
MLNDRMCIGALCFDLDVQDCNGYDAELLFNQVLLKDGAITPTLV